MKERAIEQIHADDPERFLLIDIRFVEHPDMDHDLARLAPRLILETNAQPAVRLVVLFETARRHRIRKNKKRPDAAEFFVQPLDEQTVFVVEHRLETVADHITLRGSVNRVAKWHVVRGHRLGDRARRAADVEKSPRHFLARTDLGERPLLLCVEIYLERLFVRPEIHLRLHVPKMLDIGAVVIPGRADATSARAARCLPESSRADRSATRRKSNRRGRSELRSRSRPAEPECSSRCRPWPGALRLLFR